AAIVIAYYKIQTCKQRVNQPINYLEDPPDPIPSTPIPSTSISSTSTPSTPPESVQSDRSAVSQLFIDMFPEARILIDGTPVPVQAQLSPRRRQRPKYLQDYCLSDVVTPNVNSSG